MLPEEVPDDDQFVQFVTQLLLTDPALARKIIDKSLTDTRKRELYQMEEAAEGVFHDHLDEDWVQLQLSKWKLLDCL